MELHRGCCAAMAGAAIWLAGCAPGADPPALSVSTPEVVADIAARGPDYLERLLREYSLPAYLDGAKP